MGNIDFSEVDVLLFFYLQECGYSHSAFCLSSESNLNFNFLDKKKIPAGLLISLIQRGILFSMIETNSSPAFRNETRSPVEMFLIDNPEFMSKSFLGKNSKSSNKNLICFSYRYSIYTFNWHPRKFCLFLGTRDSSFFKLELKFEKKKKKNEKDFLQINFLDKFSEKKDVVSLDFNMKGTLLTLALFNGKIFILSETCKILGKFINHEGAVFDLKWNENSRIIMITNGYGNIFFWSSWEFCFLLKISIFKFSTMGLKWLDKNKILGFSKDHFIGFSTIFKKTLTIFKAHNFKINQMAISGAKDLVAICSDDKKISIWNSKNNFFFLNFLIGHENEILYVSFKPFTYKKFQKKKKNILYSCSLDFYLKFWEIHEKKYLTSLLLEIGPFLSFSWNSLGNKLILSLPKGVITNITRKTIISRKYLTKNKNLFDIVSHPMIDRKAGISSSCIFCF